MIETKNALITGARINDADRGILTAWVDLDYGGTGQGFGGFSLFLPKAFANGVKGPNYAGLFIWRVMEIAGVTDWSKVPGKTVRVRSEHTNVHAIGHIIKDDWFNPREEFDALESSHA